MSASKRSLLVASTALISAALFTGAASELFVAGTALRGHLIPPVWWPLPGRAWDTVQWWRYTWACATGGLPTGAIGAAAKWLGYGAAAGLVAAMPGLALMRTAGADSLPLHGKTAWATWSETRAAGLCGHSGIYVGRVGRRLLTFAGQESVALMAPPRSGKGIGVVIPNAMMFQGSGIVLDMKREVFDATAGHRAATGHEVCLFDPLSPTGETHCYNPLTYVRRGTIDCYGDVEAIAQILIPDVPGPNSFFSKAARAGFIGVATMVAESDDIALTMGSVVRILVRPDVRAFINGRLEEARAAGRPYSQACADACRSFVNARADTFEDIRKTITADMGVFLNPRIAAATARNDFDLREMRRQRMWLYVAVTPSNVERLRPLLNLLFQQFVDAMTSVRPELDPLSLYQVLLLLDEFPQLGRMPVLASAAAFLAGYDTRTIYVMQNKRQLRELYGDSGGEALVATCGLELIYGTKDQQLAEELSKRIGTDTVKSTSVSRPRSWLGVGGRNSETVADTGRPLLLPQDITRLASHEVLAFRSGTPPVKARRITYYLERPFRKLVRPPPSVPRIEIPMEYDEGHGVQDPAGQRGIATPSEGAISPDLSDAFRLIFATPEEDAIREEIEQDGAVRIRR